MRFKRFACVAGAVALTALSLAPLSATVASADYVVGGVGSPYPDGYANPFGGYTFSYVNFFNRNRGLSPIYSIDIPRYWGAGKDNDNFAEDGLSQHKIGQNGLDSLDLVNLMSSGYLALEMEDFVYGYGSAPIGSFTYPYAYISSTPDTVSCLSHVLNSYMYVTNNFGATSQQVLYEVKYSFKVRKRDNSGWATFTDSVYPFISDYDAGNRFYIGSWLYDSIGENFKGDSLFPDVAYANQSNVELYFTTTKGVGHTEEGTDIDVYVPTCFYGYLCIEFYSTGDVGGNLNDIAKFQFAIDDRIEYSTIVAYVNDYYASTLVYDTVGDAFGSVLDIPRVFFSTDIVLGFSFGDLLLIALGVFLFGLGLKIALGG
jgi:hypothetical protein